MRSLRPGQREPPEGDLGTPGDTADDDTTPTADRDR
jgi:hypothetical protein